jgi:SprT protein
MDASAALVPAALRRTVEARLDALLALAAKPVAAAGRPPLPAPTLRWFDHRLDAGRALPPEVPGGSGVIELNAVYLRAEPEAMLRETLAHELAHLLVFHLHPRRRLPPHGSLWRTVMREWLGVEPERTHRFPTDGVRARRQRRWRYRCGCAEHALTTVRHRRIQDGAAAYRCRRCHGPLEPIPESPAP